MLLFCIRIDLNIILLKALHLSMNPHDYHMLQCISLALKGGRLVAPNPMVGSVIVHDGHVIGKGFHAKYGGPHAEVMAIHSVEDQAMLKKSILYVNLEPCSHHGKTPPCADLIIEKGIRTVVIGTSDPNPKVAGKGIKKLIEAGVEVIVGIREKECEELNHRFFTFIRKSRPYVILKWAETSDRFIAALNQTPGKPLKISNPDAQLLLHQWRSEEQAILAGSKTVLMDNPMLNVRLIKGVNPQIIILGHRETIPSDANIFKSDPVFVSNLNSLTNYCLENGILSVLVEGGAQTLKYFLDQDYWDEARVIINPNLQLHEGIPSPHLPVEISKQVECGDNLIKFYYRHG